MNTSSADHGGLADLVRLSGQLTNPRLHAADPDNYNPVDPPDELTTLFPERFTFAMTKVAADDRGGAIGTLARAERDGRAHVVIDFDGEGPILLTIVNLVEEIGLLAFIASDAADLESVDTPSDPLGRLDQAPTLRASATIIIEANGDVLSATGDLDALLGHQVDDDGRSQRVFDHIHPDDRIAMVENAAQLFMEPGRSATRRMRVRQPDDSWRWIQATVQVVDGQRLRADLHDVTEEMAALRALEQSEERFRGLAEAFPIGVFRADDDGNLVFANERFRDLTGFQTGDHDMISIVHPDDLPDLADAIASLRLHGKNRFDVQIRIRSRAGAERFCRLRVTLTRDEDGKALDMIGSLEDITESRALQDKLAHHARFDALTGVLNRRSTEEELRHRLDECRADETVVLLFVDLDNFKTVNDTLGHNTGDLVLINLAQRLQAQVRPGDVVGRFGGDEFLVISCGHVSASSGTTVAQRLHDALEEPFEVQGSKLRIRASIGVASSPGGEGDPEELMRHADLAMFEAKASQQAKVHVADGSLHARATRRATLEADLRPAMLDGGFHLALQPVVQLDTGDIIAVESLSRWTHPEYGPIGPLEFVPMAEELGLSYSFSTWLLEAAAGAWRDLVDRTGRSDLIVGANISSRQLGVDDFVAMVHRTAVRHDMPLNRLGIELTETILIDSVEPAEAAARALAQSGVAIAIDDFGTGYASLAYLDRLPAVTVKLDRSFVVKLEHSPHTRTVVAGLARICGDLGIFLVAEGIETDRQLEIVQEIGIQVGQGYLLGRPTDIDGISELLTSGPLTLRDSRAPRGRATA